MSHNPIANVLEFHTTFRCPIADAPCVPDGPHTLELTQVYNHLMELRTYMRQFSKADVRCQRMALDIEEAAEKCKAFAERDLKGVLDAGADVDYLNAGDMITCGLQNVFYEACTRVHTSNMSKTDENGNPVFDESGKVKKSDLYEPVDLTDLVDGSWLAEQEELAKL